ncbi:hypothetical protein [Flavobacterium sp. K5-23]|uniref:hypothetical protein n=1 Tax=Flavobacterium sp. K5-23 TaxID=2746225 RepID=UPI0020103396|nr:hypothetical protein [Flavobacterium sp. K5-23]UQD54919.1 hypothetical protein FLAK523_00380 [Flavobacterium sp. K5-23]
MLLKTLVSIVSVSLLFLNSSIVCNVTENIFINDNSSGKIEIISQRDEYRYMQFLKEDYAKEEGFIEEIITIKELIHFYKDTFSRFSKAEQTCLKKHEQIEIYNKENSIDKEYIYKLSQNFNSVNEIVDLKNGYKYINCLKDNRPMNLDKEEKEIKYSFDGIVFNRSFKVLNNIEFIKYREMYNEKSFLLDFNKGLTYTLNYHFPRKIKSVSNVNAIIGADQKSLKLIFLLTDCLQNPEITNLEVVLE